MTDIANKGLRVAHVNRDKAGNIHAREGWIINPATEKKSTIKIVYADSGESADVPAEELRIIGIASSSKIIVEHKASADEKPRRGTIVKCLEQDELLVLFDGEEKPEEVPAKEVVLIGEEV